MVGSQLSPASQAAGAGDPEDTVEDESWPKAPVEWEADVVLRDGTVAHIRPITPADADRLRQFHNRQSDESIYFRFFAPLRS